MTDTTDRPLVTFAVIAYNQERYIREAIEGAFAQTYEPLEIILSDDGSPDRTFDIMQEMAATYDGPHKVVLNRNAPNIGLVPHVNRIFDLASGDLICVNAGDDVSRSDRAEVICSRWQAHGRRHDIIHSAVHEIDEDSTPLGCKFPFLTPGDGLSRTEKYAYGKQEAFGSTFAYTRRLIDRFGPIPDHAEVEDRPMIFRAALAGGILFIDDPLLYYRTGGMSFHERETHGHSVLFGGRIKILSWRVSSARCYLQDLSVCGVDAGDIDTQYLRDFIHRHEWEIDLSRAGWFPERLMMMPEAFTRSHASRSFKPLRCYLKYLAWPVYLVFLNLRGAPKKGSPE